ncbi:VOC family protein [Polaribacter sp.]|uniref:VOC family protein n=1 Tax=Polaribacter sp. TaxID=1920175 RepID=UPI0025F6A0B8|nr:VOC family protein [Polaribacter sp.]
MNLNQVTILSLDLDKAVIFYKTLGLNLIVDALPYYARFLCPDDNATFSIHKVEQLSQNSETSIYFECENLDDKVSNLISQGIIFDELPNDKPWLWREVRLKDLYGNQLILYFAGENRINPPWKIKT